jgi:hypothetical protein
MEDNTWLTILTVTAIILLIFQIILAGAAVVTVLRIKKTITHIQETAESASELVNKLEGYFIGGRILRSFKKILRR